MLEYSGAQELMRGWRRSSTPETDSNMVVDLNGGVTHPPLNHAGTSVEVRHNSDPVVIGAEPEESLLESTVHFGTAEIEEVETFANEGSPANKPRILDIPDVSRTDSLAVGRTLRVITHAFDLMALAVPVAGKMVYDTAKYGPDFTGFKLHLGLIVFYCLLGVALLAPTARRGRLVVPASEDLVSIVGRVCLVPVFTLMVTGMSSILRFGANYDKATAVDIAVLAAVTVPLVLIGRAISAKLIEVVRARGYDLEDVIIVGTGPTGVQVAKALEDNPQFGLRPYGFVDRFDDEMPLPLIGRPEDLRDILQISGVRHVVLAFGAAEETELVDIIRDCGDQMVKFYAVPRLFELGVSADALGKEVSGLPLVEVRSPGTASNMWPAKRAFDIVVAGFLTLLATPVLLACALAVRLSSRGPIFFRQVRVGVGGAPFEILKFRTMRVNDDSSTQWSVDDDDRVTWAGKFLRPTHLDELPQLLNVLRGEMSLVGPRPERPHFVEQFSSEIDEYNYRHRVPVGITGWAQVNGYWGDTSIETRVRLDNRYIENWSLWRDLVIGLRTIPTLLGKRR